MKVECIRHLLVEGKMRSEIMIEKIGRPAMLEQLAEEASELAQAALKLARIERGENPTPVTEDEAYKNLVEEYTDVETCARELCLRADPEIEAAKRQRFYDRISTQDKKPHPVDCDDKDAGTEAGK